MESFQEGYLRAVCASAGCVIARPEIDEGIDVSVTHRADSHLATDRVARLEIQLKATTASDFGSDFVKVRLGQERYNYYAVLQRTQHPRLTLTCQAHGQTSRIARIAADLRCGAVRVKGRRSRRDAV
ncbi:DUF4365 domain-containing protein, partial [Ramlibacter ginsenosidimutans]|uniref:DUF4365 domain-containing protein n=1 Tax=Ramlibacter ginsenosidimutans TaxID=502333 RepID=UPI00363E3645